MPNTTTDQNTEFHSREQQIKEITTIFKEQQVNQVNQSSFRPANADNQSRQNKTRFRPYCQRNGHTLMCCRTKAHDDEIKRQQTQNTQEQFSLMITIKENDLTLSLRILRILFSNPDTEIRTITYTNINKLASTQIGTEIQTQIDTFTKTDQATLATKGQKTDSKLSITSTLDQRILILNTIKTNHFGQK